MYYGSPTSVAGDGPPAKTVLHQNVPNPFNPATAIQFDLARNAHVSLRVYDVSGRLVRTVTDRDMTRSRYSFTWDGTSNSGQRVASGVYFYRLTTPEGTQVRKMVLLM